MVWRIGKVEKNEKIECNGMVEMGGANKWSFKVKWAQMGRRYAAFSM